MKTDLLFRALAYLEKYVVMLCVILFNFQFSLDVDF